MRLGRVVGTVVATRKVDLLLGRRLLVVQPVDESDGSLGPPLVAIDTVSAGPGERVYFVEKREAAKAFGGRELPSDVTILGIVDRTEVET